MSSARSGQTAVVLSMILALCPSAFALNPSLDVNQFGHTTWTIRDGFLKGAIRSIVQTADGYLWLGTEFGLARFDGIRIVPWSPPDQHLPSNNIRSLLAARDGTLWIGTLEGLASWKDGKLTRYPETAGQNVLSLAEDHERTVWAGTFGLPAAKLCEIRGGKTRCYGQDGSLGEWVYGLYEDAAGRLWVGAMTGLWQWKPGPPRHYPLPYFIDSAQSIVGDDSRTGLLFLSRAIHRIANSKIDDYRLPGIRWSFTPVNLLRDSDGALWVGTLEHGLLHVYGARTDVFTQRDGLSSDHVLCSFEDREGNIWVATSEGLDRFRRFAAVSISAKQGLSSPNVMTALAARDGAVWISTQDGLNNWNRGEISVYRTAGWHATKPDFPEIHHKVREIIEPALGDKEVGSLYEDDRGRVWVSGYNGIARYDNGRFTRLRGAPGGWVNVIAGDGGEGVWIAYQDLGLQHVVRDHVLEQFSWSKLGHGPASVLNFDPQNRDLWLGFFEGGLVCFKDGQIRAAYGKKDGFGAGRVMGLQRDADGVLWASTEGGLSRIETYVGLKDARHIINVTSANGLPCDGVHWTIEDDDHFFWLYTPCGLIRVARSELQALVSRPNGAIQSTVFDASDGVRMKALLTGYTPRVSKAPDGKIWFAHLDSVSVIDPRHLPVNEWAPPVHIEQITGDGKIYWKNSSGSSADIRLAALPPRTRKLEIEYTALSLIAPEKVRFKYKLEGYDTEWQEAGARRQAFYGNLPPRKYHFRVTASNNSGVWNEAGDALDFSIDPAYYQTTWFRIANIAGFVLLMFGLYRLRVYQIAREFNAQFEGRVDERLRVARELHDTLLQSFQGLTISFQAVRNLLPNRLDQAVSLFDKLLDQAGKAIVEGREAIQNMRVSTTVTNDLGQALRAVGEELASEDSAQFRVVIEGSPRNIHPVLRDEIYQFAREAMRNAFHHAQAQKIEAEINYNEGLRVRIRDDGMGIDPAIAKQGRAGHYGLPGMRERAAQIGAKFNIWTAPRSGTEIELSIPGSIAYGTSGTGILKRLLGRRGGGQDTPASHGRGASA